MGRNPHQRELRESRNSKTSPDELRMLSRHKDDSVVWNVAANPNTPVDVLQELSKSECVLVLFELCTNPNTPKAVINFLTRHPDDFVSEQAQRYL